MVSLFLSSCEYEPSGDNYHDIAPLPSEIGVSINLADAEIGDVIYIYGPTSFYYQVEPEIGQLHSVEFTFNGQTIEQFGNYYFIDTKGLETDEVMDLKIDITIVANDNTLAGAIGKYGQIYSATANYKIKYIKITSGDFAVKSQEIDRIVLQMIKKDHGTCKYIFNGEEIIDLDNIIFKRDRFPGIYKMRINILPPYTSYSDIYVEIEFGDKKLGNFSTGSTVSHYFDQANQELYAWSMNELFIHDKDMNILSHKKIEDIHDLMVTPITGLVVSRRFSTATTYSDKSFSTVVSTISNNYTMNFRINERDQLFQYHNFQIDVFDLHTGNKIYTIDLLPNGIYDLAIAADGKYLFAKTSGKSYVYLLADDSASLQYSLEDNYTSCQFHPINKNHIILTSYNNGFAILDIETQQIVFANKGEYQSCDPITGNLLFWDENYSYQTRNYKNHFIDKSYTEIYTMIDDTRSTYGAYKLFNNYIIKDNYYVNVSPQLADQ